MTSWFMNTNASSRRCSRFSSELDSRLSTQMTRFPCFSRYSQRWEPRKPAPPVTTAVGIRMMVSASQAGSGAFGRALRRSYAGRGNGTRRGADRAPLRAVVVLELLLELEERLQRRPVGEGHPRAVAGVARHIRRLPVL